MKNLTVFYLVLICSLSMASLSYGLMLSSHEVIDHAKNIYNEDARSAYLLRQAEVFLGKDRYEEAEALANYVVEHHMDDAPRATKLLARIEADQSRREPPVVIVDNLQTLEAMTEQRTVKTVFEDWADHGNQDNLR